MKRTVDAGIPRKARSGGIGVSNQSFLHRFTPVASGTTRLTRVEQTLLEIIRAPFQNPFPRERWNDELSRTVPSSV